MKFNKTEPYGTVYGHTEIAYEQNGHQFKPDYSLYDPEGKKPAEVVEQEKWSKRRE